MFEDTNGNGQQDRGEAGIANIELALEIGGSGDKDAFATTDAEGFYSFTNLDPNDYEVHFPGRSGWTITTQDSLRARITDADSLLG